VTAISAFPSRYFEIAGEFQTGKRRSTVRCDTPRQAVTRRLDLYRFRAALRREGLVDEYSQFFAVKMYVRGRNLVLVHADETFK
jgi:hypothetical protein